MHRYQDLFQYLLFIILNYSRFYEPQSLTPTLSGEDLVTWSDSNRFDLDRVGANALIYHVVTGIDV